MAGHLKTGSSAPGPLPVAVLNAHSLAAMAARSASHVPVALHRGTSTGTAYESSVTMRDAERAVLRFVREHAHYRQAQIAGNSVYVDFSFIRRAMPELFDYFDHRVVDVSSVALLWHRWRGREHRRRRRPPRKKGRHTAMSDVLESVEELRFYRDNFFLRGAP